MFLRLHYKSKQPLLHIIVQLAECREIELPLQTFYLEKILTFPSLGFLKIIIFKSDRKKI